MSLSNLNLDPRPQPYNPSPPHPLHSLPLLRPSLLPLKQSLFAPPYLPTVHPAQPLQYASRSRLMSLDQITMFAERRLQPSDRSSYPSHDHLIHPTSSWNYSPRSSASTQNNFPQQISSAWNTHQYTATWPSPSATFPSPPSPPPPYLALNSNYRHSGSTLFHHTEYPASSPRAVVSPAHSPLSSCLSPGRPAQNSLSSISSNLKYDNQSWGEGLYTIDDPETASNSERPASSVATSPSARASSIASSTCVPPVKVEPEDSVVADCFVMEFSSPTPAAQASSSLAPPTEVPLRATQASKAMRKMMGVFRLNPFSMHESGGQPTTTWTGEDAGPLEEEPQMFEFQLDLQGYEREQPQQQSASSNKTDGDFDETGNWGESRDPPLHYSTTSHTGWIGNESPASYALPSLRPYSPHPPLHSPSPSSLSSRRTPLDNASSDYTPSYTLPMPSSCAASIDNLPSISSMARRWSNTTNLQHPFML